MRAANGVLPVAAAAVVRAVELEPTLRRRYLAARAADRLSDLPAVSREMEEVLAAHPDIARLLVELFKVRLEPVAARPFREAAGAP